MRIIILFFIISVSVSFLSSCNTPLVGARVARDIKYVSEVFPAGKEATYYALRWALKNHGYPVAEENIKKGYFKTSWVPTTSDSHAMEVFGRPDFGVNGAYFRMDVNIISEGPDSSRVEVGSEIKSVASGVKSTGIEEKRILREAGRFLRVSEPNITNLGIEE